ncbi:unnamed protein product, partial [Discosporangium mesarthrocarpum]
ECGAVVFCEEAGGDDTPTSRRRIAADRNATPSREGGERKRLDTERDEDKGQEQEREEGWVEGEEEDEGMDNEQTPPVPRPRPPGHRLSPLSNVIWHPPSGMLLYVEARRVFTEGLPSCWREELRPRGQGGGGQRSAPGSLSADEVR